MNKRVEDYINKNIRNNSNANRGWRSRGVSIPTTYTPWLVPNVARKVAEIAREETIKEVCEWIIHHYRNYMHNPTGKQLEAFFGMDMVGDLKKHLEDKA